MEDDTGLWRSAEPGFLYYEVLEIIQSLAKRSNGQIVGMDLVEVAPAYDLSGTTAILAAQLLLNSLGFIFHARKQMREESAAQFVRASIA